jgi:hypothetical protein
MPYPLTTPSAASGGRVRLLPPWGCPGDEEWVLHQEVDRWRQLGYRLGPVPALPLELFWHPADSQWNEPLGSAAIRLRIDPRALVPQPVVVDWGDGTSETLSWDPIDRVVPNPRHVYQERSDLTVTVQIGMTVASLAVALVGCPLPPTASRPSGGGSASGSLGGVEPLVPGAGLQGNPYNGTTAQQWQLRLHPEGGLGLLPSPVDGEPSLAVMYGSGAASRGTRWYSGDGPPDTATLAPPPAPGDLYLDRVSGQVFELMV